MFIKRYILIVMLATLQSICVLWRTQLSNNADVSSIQPYVQGTNRLECKGDMWNYFNILIKKTSPNLSKIYKTMGGGGFTTKCWCLL